MIPSGTTIYETVANLLRKAVIALAVFVLLLWAIPAFSQGRNCADRATVVGGLADVYGESRQSVGLRANKTVFEMFANLETGTWTATVTTPHGITCLVAVGQAFELVQEELAPIGVPM